MAEKDSKAEKDGKSETKETKKDTLPNHNDQPDEQDKMQELNDGDEFEEFPIYSQSVDSLTEEPQVVNVWADTWEDESAAEENFVLQLSEELGNKDILKTII